MAVRAVVVALALLVAACGEGGQSVASGDVVDASTTTTLLGDEVRAEALGEGSWQGARTSPDPKLVVIAIIGAAPYQPRNPCTADYSAVAIETSKEVRIRFVSRSPSWTSAPGVNGCHSIGYSRMIEVRLRVPLGDRALVEAQFDRQQPVFDGSRLYVPTWLPRGMSLVAEQPGYPDHERARYWQRTWAATRPDEPDWDGSCVAGQPPVTLTQGPADLVDRHPVANATVGEPTSVGGTAATYRSNERGDMSELRWVQDGVGLVLSTHLGCDRDTPMRRSTLMRIAESLKVEPPTSDEGESPIADPTTTTSEAAPSSADEDGRPPPHKEFVVGSTHYVDVDLECQAFELFGVWTLADGDTSSWQPPGERHEGGMFTIEEPGRGRFVGDAEGRKTAVFERLDEDEVPTCTPVPRA